MSYLGILLSKLHYWDFLNNLEYMVLLYLFYLYLKIFINFMTLIFYMEVCNTINNISDVFQKPFLCFFVL